jgi:hypothetical protein
MNIKEKINIKILIDKETNKKSIATYQIISIIDEEAIAQRHHQIRHVVKGGQRD